MKILENYLELLQEKMWSGKVKLKHHFKKGTFKKGSETIEKKVEGSGGDCQKKMSRLNFYINRAGKNLSASTKSKLEKAKDILHNKCAEKK